MKHNAPSCRDTALPIPNRTVHHGIGYSFRGYFSHICSTPRFSLAGLLCLVVSAFGQSPNPTALLFQNVRVFNGTDTLLAPTNVLVVGNLMVKISSANITVPGIHPTVMDGGGQTLMPGLIDAHSHLMFNSLSQLAMMTSDTSAS